MNYENTEERDCLSLQELMFKAFQLSLDICYETITEEGFYHDLGDLDKSDIPYKEKFIEDSYAWVDGLYHKYYEKMSSGRCSLKAMIDFDIEKFENKVIEYINRAEEVLKILPPIKILTKEIIS